MLFEFFTPPPPRRKFQVKLKEAEEALAAAEQKYSSLDKTKHRIETELEDLNLDLEKVHTGISDCLTSRWPFNLIYSYCNRLGSRTASPD